jgi:hypothetical protein
MNAPIMESNLNCAFDGRFIYFAERWRTAAERSEVGWSGLFAIVLVFIGARIGLLSMQWDRFGK